MDLGHQCSCGTVQGFGCLNAKEVEAGTQALS